MKVKLYVKVFQNKELQILISILPCFIAGAVEAGRKFKCSPIQALDFKEFTSGY